MPSRFSRIRNHSPPQQLLEDGFTQKSGNCLQGIPTSTQQRNAASISGSGTFLLSLASTCSHPTAPTPREMDTAEWPCPWSSARRRSLRTEFDPCSSRNDSPDPAAAAYPGWCLFTQGIQAGPSISLKESNREFKGTKIGWFVVVGKEAFLVLLEKRQYFKI